MQRSQATLSSYLLLETQKTIFNPQLYQKRYQMTDLGPFHFSLSRHLPSLQQVHAERWRGEEAAL